MLSEFDRPKPAIARAALIAAYQLSGGSGINTGSRASVVESGL
jgi:hypothetical protein